MTALSPEEAMRMTIEIKAMLNITNNAVEVERAEDSKKKKVKYHDLPQDKKLFLGGLPVGLAEEELHNYFAKFGVITDHVIISDQVTKKPRGFGFVSFETDEAVSAVLGQGRFHSIKGKDVEVTRATPKKPEPKITVAVPVPASFSYMYQDVKVTRNPSPEFTANRIPTPTCFPCIYEGMECYYYFPNCVCGASFGTSHYCPLASGLYYGPGTPVVFPASH